MRRIVVLCMCLIALVLVGCSEERVWQENAVVYALEAEPSDLDPAMTTSLPESIAELQIFEGLTILIRTMYRSPPWRSGGMYPMTAKPGPLYCGPASFGVTARP